jgi:hypothetical protein
MFEKFFHTATADRKLPVPFFEVLDQEQAALHGTARNNYSWDFAENHLKEPVDGLAEKLKPLFPAEAAERFSADTRKDLIARLNELLRGACLYDQPHFPKPGLGREIVAMSDLKLDPSELKRLNRLLLEAAFPQHLKTIADIHLESIYRRIHAGEGSAALCFSGGGIRSATFALGVTQGLAQRGVIRHFDYLSTVSGGGYIGSWLSSWIQRTGDAQKVFDALAPARAASPLDPEPPTLDHLRKYSNYLTPKLGLFSADAWTLVATYLRNLLLNWIVFIPLLIAFFALPRFHVAMLVQTQPPWLVGLTFLAGGLLAVGALAYCAMNRPTVAKDLAAHGRGWFTRRGQGDFLIYGLVPLFLAALCFTTAWAWAHNTGGLRPHNYFLTALLRFVGCTAGAPPPRLLNFCVIGAAVHLAGWLVAEGFLQRWGSGRGRTLRWELVLALVTGAVGGLLLWVAALKLPFSPENAGPIWYGCLAAPLVMISFLFAATVFIGAGSKFTSDEDREWWARMGGWMFITIFGWAGFTALVLAGPLGVLACWFWAPKTISLLGGASGLFTLIVGYSGSTAAKPKSKAGASVASGLLDQALKLLAAPVFLALLVVGLSLATSWLLVQTGTRCGLDFSPLGGFTCAEITGHFKQVIRESPAWYIGVFIFVTAAVGWSLSWLINVNKFSLHAIYRNRLVRAYLGASNFKRNPNPFTGFDPADNLPLAHLRRTPPGQTPKSDHPPQRPLHIINMALNLVTGDNLAWQQRKAETFTASTLHCGNHRLGYRYTNHYAIGPDGTGLKLGTAVAISGAAASPNQGYHSSPLVALLMTFFNIRLGWWLGNPGAMGHATFSDPSPRSPVVHYLKEGLGLTDNTSPYVYLSDGGHFENLGLYEMILRRCRFIVVSDAGCDPDCSLEDLGNAIRKIRVDLGVRIEMHQKFEIFSRDDEPGERKRHYCALGDIDYGSVDPGGRRGTLIYLKPALIGSEPRDIFNYSRQSEEFPHESTGDQWFSEAQFESYRALGQRAVEWLYGWRASDQPRPTTRADVFKDLIVQAYTASDTPRPGHTDDLFKSEKSLRSPEAKA